MERALYELNRFDTDGAACYFEPQYVAGGAEPAGAWLGMANYDKAMFILLGGNCTNVGDVLTAAVWQATSAAGANLKLVVGKNITAYTTGAMNLNNLWYIAVNVDELDVDNAFAWIQLVITVSAADSMYLAAVCQRQSRVFEPVPVPSVTEIIA